MMFMQRLRQAIQGRPAWWFALRVVWMAILLMLVVLLGERGAVFFYQGF